MKTPDNIRIVLAGTAALMILVAAGYTAGFLQSRQDRATNPGSAFPFYIYENVKPPTGEEIATQTTFTHIYLAGLPADALAEDILDQNRLEAFIRLNKGDLLSDVPLDSINIAPAGNKSRSESISEYIDNISAVKNNNLYLINHHMIDEAFADQLNFQPDTMRTLIERLEHNLEVLKNLAAPADAIDLHAKIIAANQSLLDNIRRLRDINDDFVGGLIGSQNIADLSAVFADITRDIEELPTDRD